MCGITGILEFGHRTPSEKILRRMVGTMIHRGPDSSRVVTDSSIGLGQTRLRVLDLSEEADQPMWNEDRTVAIVFNGEIYNFCDLRNDARARREPNSKTRSDTEVVLKLYETSAERADLAARRYVRARHLGRPKKATLVGPRPCR